LPSIVRQIAGRFLIMLDNLTNFIGRVGHWGYLIIFIGVTLECAALFFLPGESLVLFGGFLAGRGVLDWGDLAILVSMGAILGYCIGFEIGRRFGRRGVLRYGRWVGIGERHLDRIDAFFARHGGKTVLIGRFTSFFRPLVALAAGSAKLPFGQFLLYNVLGGILWSVTFVLLGYFFGASWQIIERSIGRAGGIVGLVLLFVGVGIWLWRTAVRALANWERQSNAGYLQKPPQ
jgi:membrane protein DedA with SNARE-associated domain